MAGAGRDSAAVAARPGGRVVVAFAGGAAYTGGHCLYAAERACDAGHFVWHLFVLIGTICHGIAVWRYA